MFVARVALSADQRPSFYTNARYNPSADVWQGEINKDPFLLELVHYTLDTCKLKRLS